ncbi:MAG: tRNA pseudouridine(55) synthase TruB [Gracilimonas sp.]|uniref:tRNA pseudouridine(55) synthase TruB n=1 Tax=Gracilimonas TaxID=649462 RepID=UPI001B2A9D3F|nr:tRNA pseudouridine(55) synthase TruB [Gracilimonas sp.]MBO6586291.1 tRNA pseudouridine(55) synthase TruB [Gracilimonas sp.]MBO6614948.1 tRNA pseudouridine(55) synthase TruB [Gracilimonas sp.]
MARTLPLDEIPVFGKNNLPDKDTNLSDGAIFLIDKPLEWSSFDVVKFLRKRIRVKKVGHAGTLDPLATGMLILCCGKATKSISMIQDLPKVYTGEITFGKATTTYDAEGEVTEEASWDHITKEKIVAVLDKEFTGTVEQIPPMYSALKYGGKKLYELARKGEEVVRLPRQVTFHDHEILNFEPPRLTLKIKCSKGTYIRSLARDLGEALGSKAYLSGLERTAIGDFLVDDALTPHEMGDQLKEIWQS